MDAFRDERIARATLGWLSEPGDAHLRQLLATHGPVESLHMLPMRGLPFVARTEIRHLSGARLWEEAAVAVNHAQRGTGRVVIPADPDWPTGLRDLDGAEPVCLWAQGPAPIPPQATSVTIIGSRASSDYGKHVAADLASQLTTWRWTVVSTGGLGVDGVALRAALVVNGEPVAVLPHGIDQMFPAAHRPLFEHLADKGLLLSAWPPGARPTLQRMRANQSLLATLTAGTVVVEASVRSNALEVVRQAVNRGRVGMVVPGPVTSAISAGCHDLLRAEPRIRPVTNLADILADLALRPQPTAGGADTTGAGNA
ncbi:DNA processing protein [Micromonospora sp. Llam0]|uniref:DNA-processing protein DprA n=1 Tax=Micromonospora sp. Llam0 TaxID=2485143 RepID=UPI000F496BE7|nr:DNA-processing protein DprA [Micromonospora sp. Llam0]ROO60339.1 DNA processing protein [Micromonospora sp. Llam0]